MHKPKFILEKEMHKILQDFEIPMDHSILARKPNIVLINKKKGSHYLVDFALSADHRVEIKESKKTDKCQDLARKLKAEKIVGMFL